MGADVADRAAGAGARRVGAPVGLLVAGLLERRRSASPADIRPAPRRISPSSPVRHHRARLPDHRIAGVVVGQHEDARRSRGDSLRQLPRLGQRRGQRLVADDVDAALRGTPWRRRSACGSGVTIATASMPSGRAGLGARPSPRSRRRCGRGAARARAPDACARSGVDDSAPATSS